MSGMETIKGKFQGLIDVLMPWEDVEVEEHREAAAEKSQQQAAAKPARAAAQEYKVSGGDSIYVERTEAQEPAPSFRTRTRAQWCELLEGTDACFAPVLSMKEAADHPHNTARGTFLRPDGVLQPAPAPRFDRTPTALPPKAPRTGEHTTEILAAAGYAPAEIELLVHAGVAFTGVDG